jgi:hypothetical protein
MGVSAHMEPCFTLMYGCRIAQVLRVTYGPQTTGSLSMISAACSAFGSISCLLCRFLPAAPELLVTNYTELSN